MPTLALSKNLIVKSLPSKICINEQKKCFLNAWIFPQCFCCRNGSGNIPIFLVTKHWMKSHLATLWSWFPGPSIPSLTSHWSAHTKQGTIERKRKSHSRSRDEFRRLAAAARAPPSSCPVIARFLLSWTGPTYGLTELRKTPEPGLISWSRLHSNTVLVSTLPDPH